MGTAEYQLGANSCMQRKKHSALFSLGAIIEKATVDELVQQLGHHVRYFMHRMCQLDRCRVVVANLNGVTTDDGTAWEIGYAHAKAKHIIGLHTDWRRRFDDEVVNLMLERSVDQMVRSLDELDSALTLLLGR